MDHFAAGIHKITTKLCDRDSVHVHKIEGYTTFRSLSNFFSQFPYPPEIPKKLCFANILHNSVQSEVKEIMMMSKNMQNKSVSIHVSEDEWFLNLLFCLTSNLLFAHYTSQIQILGKITNPPTPTQLRRSSFIMQLGLNTTIIDFRTEIEIQNKRKPMNRPS